MSARPYGVIVSDVQRRDPMIDIHIRVSRRLVFALVLVFIVLPVVWVMLQTLGGHSQGGVNVGPIQTVRSP